MALQLSFRSDLYLGESMQKENLAKLKRQLSRRPLLTDVYLLTEAANPNNQLEFFHSRFLAQPYYQKNPPCILGLAGSYDEASRLVVRILDECLKERGDCSIREFITCRQS